MRGSIEKFVSSSSGSDGGVQSPKLHQGGEFESDDDCGNGGALIFRVNDSRHVITTEPVRDTFRIVGISLVDIGKS
jgi:hypothetical protein